MSTAARPIIATVLCTCTYCWLLKLDVAEAGAAILSDAEHAAERCGKPQVRLDNHWTSPGKGKQQQLLNDMAFDSRLKMLLF